MKSVLYKGKGRFPLLSRQPCLHFLSSRQSRSKKNHEFSVWCPRALTHAIRGPVLSSHPPHAELSAGEHLSDAFAQVNPVKKVPAMKDNDFTLSER